MVPFHVVVPHVLASIPQIDVLHAPLAPPPAPRALGGCEVDFETVTGDGAVVVAPKGAAGSTLNE